MKPPPSQHWDKKPSLFWGKHHAAMEKLIPKLAAQPTIPDDKSLGKLAKLAGKLDEVAATPAPSKRSTAPKVDGPPLAQALAHAGSGRVVDLIDALLVAWRANRAPELADAIDRATRLLPTYDQAYPIEPKALDAAWHAALAADPAGAMPQLLAAINCGGAGAAERHVLELAVLPDDPRIAIRFAEAACLFPLSPERTQYWKTLWETYARTGDTRGNATLRRHFRDFTGTYYNHHRQGRRIVGDFVMTATPPALADHKALNQVLAALAKLEAKQDRTERDFITAIVKEWDDEGPRLVYADWLIERNHPRGEAIVLSCKAKREALSAEEKKRMSALIGGFRNPSHVYGPFSDVDFDLDRGMVTVVKPDHSACALTWRRLVGHPLLPTLETIVLHDERDDRGQPSAEDLAPVMLDPTATRLARVVGPSAALATELEPLIKTKWKRDGKDYVRR
jgi:uncharacterized protein (TIGR02996 family)